MPRKTALRAALNSALAAFAASEAGSQRWCAIQERIENINYHDAKTKLKAFISRLSDELLSVPEGFSDDVIDLRNTLVHDIGRIKQSDYNRLSFFVTKLKAAYAINDAMALGAKVGEIGTSSTFLLRARHTHLNMFSDEVEDASSDCGQ